MFLPFVSKAKKAFRESLDESQREDFDKFSENTREKLDDAALTVKCRMDNVRDALRNVRSNATRGFTNSEIWNFGDYITVRAANVCAYLADAEYDVAPAYLGELVDKERVLRGHEILNSTAMDSASGKLIDYMKMFEIENSVVEKKIVPAWMWFFDTLMNPDIYVAPKDTDTPLDKLIAKTSHELSYADVQNLPVTEARRMAKILKKFAENCYGSADKYATSDLAYKTIEERGGKSWEDGQSLAIGLFTHHGPDWREHIWESQDGYIKQKTRKELGVDWVAWVEDVLRAANILELYADWLDDDPASPNRNSHTSKKAHLDSTRNAMFLLEPEAAAEIEEQIMSETRNIWHWIGINIPGFWD